jgi:hypothetical protein
MPPKSVQSALFAILSGAAAAALFHWSHRAFSNNLRLDSPQKFGQMVIHSPLEFAWVDHSWFIVALILLALPFAVVRRSLTGVVIVELLGFAFAFVHVLWDVGTLPGPYDKFDLRLLHPPSVGVLVAQLCAAGTLASLVLVYRSYREENPPSRHQ